MQKELDRYLLPVLRKKYKTDLHLKKYPPKFQYLDEANASNIKSKAGNSAIIPEWVYEQFYIWILNIFWIHKYC